MTTREHLHDILPVVALVPAVRGSVDVNGETIDTRGYDSLMLVAQVGAEGDTLDVNTYFEFEVEHADDDGNGSPDSWEDVADTDLSKYVTGTNPGTFAKVDAGAEAPATYWTTYRGSKRFVRVVVNKTGTHTNGSPMSVVAIEGHPHMTPVALPTGA